MCDVIHRWPPLASFFTTTVAGGNLSEAVKFAHEFRQMSPGSKDKDEDVKPVTPPLQQQQHQHQQQQHNHLPHQPFFASMPQHFANPGNTANVNCKLGQIIGLKKNIQKKVPFISEFGYQMRSNQLSQFVWIKN